METDMFLYIATANGVFRASAETVTEHATCLGLTNKGNVRWILADENKPARVWAATERAGVWRTDDAGATWVEKNSGLVYKHTLTLARHKITGDLYVGTEPACIFKSNDDGDTWTEFESLRRLPTRIDWTFPNAPYVPHVRGIGLSPSNPDIVYGAIEEGWLVRSVDEGQRWENIKTGVEFDSHTVTILPGDPEAIIMASGKGIFKSDDGGKTFCDANAGIRHPYLVNVAAHPSRPDVLYTAGAEVPPPHWGRTEGPGGGFYRSDDGGKSWCLLTGGLPARINPAPRSVAVGSATPNTVYFGLNDGTIWITRNGGDHFDCLIEGLPPILGISPVTGVKNL